MGWSRRRMYRRVYEAHITAADIAALGAVLTGEIIVGIFPKRFRFSRANIRVVTQGAGTTTLTASIGSEAVTFANLMAAKDLKAVAATEYGDDPADLAAGLQSGFGMILSRTAETTVKAQFTATVENLEDVSAGDFWITIEGHEVNY